MIVVVSIEIVIIMMVMEKIIILLSKEVKHQNIMERNVVCGKEPNGVTVTDAHHQTGILLYVADVDIDVINIQDNNTKIV